MNTWVVHALSCLTALLLFDLHVARAASILYATDAGTQQLYTLSQNNPSATLVGGFGVGGFMAGLTYNATNNILYGTTTSTNNLYSINRSTGAATLIGPLGASGIGGIAFDNSTGTLYGSSFFGPPAQFVRIDKSTGSASLIGPIGTFSVTGLAFNPQTNALYGVTFDPMSFSSALITINPSTGAGTLIASIPGQHSFQGISFDPGTGILYGIDNGGGISSLEGLDTINISTGAATLVGRPPLNNPLDISFVAGLQAVPEPTSLTLLGVGILGLLACTRQKRQRRQPRHGDGAGLAGTATWRRHRRR